MPISNEQRIRWFVGLVLVAANVLMFAAWPSLRSTRFLSNTSDPFFEIVDGTPKIKAAPMMRNPAYLRWYFDEVRRERKVFMLGTSESVTEFNLAAQLNHLSPQGPRVVVKAAGGTSPIHACIVFARCQVDGIRVPPTILMFNLVYYMESHDVVNEGWRGNTMRTPVFLYMNRGNVRDGLSPEVNAIYDAHFRHLRVLSPVWTQRYLSNLLYLRFHQEPSDAPRPAFVPVPMYAFSGKRPAYDEARAVAPGYVASDQLAKSRWVVRDAQDSLNLKGLASIMAILDGQPAPILLLILPMNRKFYGYNGMDMTLFDTRYAEIRRRMRSYAREGHIFVVDMYDEPPLDAGFMDRMHQDAYGFHQLARFLTTSSEGYAAFMRAVEHYYATLAEE